MSFHVFFSFSQGLAERIRVPAGLKRTIMEHVEDVESALGLKRTRYKKNPVHWDTFDPEYRNGFPSVDDETLCRAVQAHNAWVRGIYYTIAKYAKEPYKGKGGEWLTPKDAQKFWHGLEMLDVDPHRWTMEYYRDQMDHVYEVMRGREDRGVTFDAKPLDPQQASAVVNLFAVYLDSNDLRLTVPNDRDYLASSYDGGYSWCEKCGAVASDDVGFCKKRKCPINAELQE